MTYAIAVFFALLVAVPIVMWLESDHPDQTPFRSRRLPPRKKPRP